VELDCSEFFIDFLFRILKAGLKLGLRDTVELVFKVPQHCHVINRPSTTHSPQTGQPHFVVGYLTTRQPTAFITEIHLPLMPELAEFKMKKKWIRFVKLKRDTADVLQTSSDNLISARWID